MHELLFLLKNHAPEITFLAVFIEQIGLPIPAMPVLIVAGAFEPSGDGLFVLISVAVVAALLADILWYFAGKRWGFKILRSLCNISLSSDSCVRQTEGIFSRFGHIALLLSKFIPGFSTVAPPLAGATGIAWAPFVLFDGLGSVTWVVLMMAIGRVFKDGIQAILVKMTKIGSWSGIVVLTLLALYILFKWWERRRFYKALEMARISVEELNALMQQGQHAPVILDVRPPSLALRGHIPGAIVTSLDELDEFVGHLSRNEEVIVYCNCPNEASAALVARALMDRGFQKVRPLRGGLEAWIDSGFAIDEGKLTPPSSLLDVAGGV